MLDHSHSPHTAREWLRILARYREPSNRRSLFELGVTLIPFVTLWCLAWMALSVNLALTLALAMFNGFFLVRLFIIQHDCGHGAFLTNRSAQDWLGRLLASGLVLDHSQNRTVAANAIAER